MCSVGRSCCILDICPLPFSLALVGRNCSEVTSQGVDELLTTLLEDIPEDKHRLLNSTEKNQMELALLMKEDTLVCCWGFASGSRGAVLVRLLAYTGYRMCASPGGFSGKQPSHNGSSDLRPFDMM